MNIILLSPQDEKSNSVYLLDDERAGHIINVLKSKPGDTIEIGIYNGDLGKAKVVGVQNGKVELEIIKTYPKVLNTPGIHLICALPRPQTLKKILFHAASMGVERIDFIKSNRVEKSFYQSHLLRKEYYGKLIKLGMSQGKQTMAPEIFFHKKFKAYFENVFPYIERRKSLKLIAENTAHRTLFDIYTNNTGFVTVAIGPEGGWIPFEIDFMKNVGFIPFSISKWTLRVEAAVISTLSQIELLSNRMLKQQPHSSNQ